MHPTVSVSKVTCTYMVQHDANGQLLKAHPAPVLLGEGYGAQALTISITTVPQLHHKLRVRHEARGVVDAASGGVVGVEPAP